MTRPKLQRFITSTVLLASAVGLLGVMAWAVRGRTTFEPSSESASEARSIPVRVFTVGSVVMDRTRRLTGVVQARYETELAFRVGGKISARLVDVGSTVAAGDVLFKLETADYELQKDSAAADLAGAVATHNQAIADEARMRTLRVSRSISDDEYDQALARRETAQARRTAAERSLELAGNRLAYTTLEAPASGVVTEVLAERGQVVEQGKSVAKLTQGHELEVVVGVPERLIASIAGSESSITYWSMPGVSSQAQLRELSPMADPITRTYQARFTILLPPRELQLGMSATLQLNEKNAQDFIVLPPGALAGTREAPVVWKINDEQGHVVSVPIQVIHFGRDEITVCGELSEGDRIVSAGVQKLDSGVTVRAWEELK